MIYPDELDIFAAFMDAERDGNDPQWAVLTLDNADDYDDPIQCDNCYAIVSGDPRGGVQL